MPTAEKEKEELDVPRFPKQDLLNRLQDEFQAMTEKHSVKNAEGEVRLKMDDNTLREYRERSNEMAALGAEKVNFLTQEADRKAQKSWETMREEGGIRRPTFSDGSGYDDDRVKQSMKSLGEQFTESAEYKQFQVGSSKQFASMESPTSLKATFDIAGATLTGYDRQPGIVMVGTQKLTVADLLARGETTMPTIRYVREDTYTNAATTVAEGAAKPEASWDTSEQDAPVRKIAVTAKVTDELFSDFPAIRDYINMRLPFMVKQTEEAQLISGNGTPPNLTGILNTSGIQTQATGTDTNPDAIYKAIVKVRTVGFFEPDAVVIHPNNWTPIRLLKTTTGEYVWGHPAEMGPERLWGLLVDVTTGITANTGLAGAFQLGAQVFYREGMRIEATNSNEDDFKKNLIAIRAEQREALAVYRPLAFCKVTSLGV